MIRAFRTLRYRMIKIAKSPEDAAILCNFAKLSIDESAFSADNIIYKKHGFQAGFTIAREPQAKRR